MKLAFCAVCGDKNVEHHHFLPKSLGGETAPTNLLTLCVTHHTLLHDLVHTKRLQHRNLVQEGQIKAKQRGRITGTSTKIKIVSNDQFEAALKIVQGRRYPDRDELMLRLLCQALIGPRHLSMMKWSWIVYETIQIQDPPAEWPAIEITRPMWAVLSCLYASKNSDTDDCLVFHSERRRALSAAAISNWLFFLYREMGIEEGGPVVRGLRPIRKDVIHP